MKRTTGISVLAATALAFSATTPLHAQAVSPAGTGEVERRVDLIDPASGPPGTQVRVASGDMPSITPIRVGLGGMRSGFESLTDILTSMDGEFDVTVDLPTWAQWDRVHRFVVFDIYFAPIALSELFHVTNEAGLVYREGRVDTAPGGCLRLRDVDGIEYQLDGGDRGVLRVGADVSIEARVVLEGDCGLPYTLSVVEARSR